MSEKYGMRSDCVRDNRAVHCPRSSTVGFSIQTAKRGSWVSYESNDLFFMGRVIGRVTCQRVVYLEVASLTVDASSVYPRWVLPQQVRTCRRVPPSNIFAFLTGEWLMANDILSTMHNGITPKEFSDEFNNTAVLDRACPSRVRHLRLRDHG